MDKPRPSFLGGIITFIRNRCLAIAMTLPATDLTGATLPRSFGRAEIARQGGRLTQLYQQGCARLLLPHRAADEAVFVNTAGGITGGDRLSLTATAGADQALTLTTQAAERIYRSTGTPAHVTNKLSLGDNARIDWLPQETILFDGASLDRRLDVDMAPSARLLALETLVFGRAAHGEVITRLHLRDQWRIRRDGRLIHAEALRLDGLPGSAATLAGIRASATLLLAAPDAPDLLAAARILLRDTPVEAGISALPGLLIGRFLAPSSQSLRAALIPLIALLRGAPPPRVWQL